MATNTIPTIWLGFFVFYQIIKSFVRMYWASWHCEQKQPHSIVLFYGAKQHSFVRDSRFASIWEVKIRSFTSKQIFWIKHVCGCSTCTQTQFRDIDASTRIKMNSNANFICDTILLSSKWTFIQPDYRYHMEFFIWFLYLSFQSDVIFNVNRLNTEESVIPYEYHHFDFCPIDETKSPTQNLGQSWWTNSTGAIQSGIHEGGAMWKGNLISLFSE